MLHEPLGHRSPAEVVAVGSVENIVARDKRDKDIRVIVKHEAVTAVGGSAGEDGSATKVWKRLIL